MKTELDPLFELKDDQQFNHFIFLLSTIPLGLLIAYLICLIPAIWL